MRLTFFLVNKSSQTFSPNVGGVIVDHLLFRCSSC